MKNINMKYDYNYTYKKKLSARTKLMKTIVIATIFIYISTLIIGFIK